MVDGYSAGPGVGPDLARLDPLVRSRD